MPLVLGHDEIRSLLTMAGAIDVIEEAVRAEARGEATFAERCNLMLPAGWMRMAPAALLDRGVTGYKEFHLSPDAHVRFEIRLFDYATGATLAAMDGRHITAMRTGAAGGVALRHCVPDGTAEVGVLGSGESATGQLEALLVVRPVRSVKVYSRDRGRRERFATTMGDRHGIPVTAVDTPEKAVDDVEILLVATDTGGQGPALQGEWLHPGLHVNSIGSTLPDQREADEAVFARADHIVVDTPGVLRDSGDVLAAQAAGTYREERVTTLSEVVGGGRPVRDGDHEITLYKSIGTAVQDVAMAHWVYEEARRRGLGVDVVDFVTPKPD